MVNLLQKSNEKPESLYEVVSVFIKILFQHVAVSVGNNTILAVFVSFILSKIDGSSAKHGSSAFCCFPTQNMIDHRPPANDRTRTITFVE